MYKVVWQLTNGKVIKRLKMWCPLWGRDSVRSALDWGLGDMPSNQYHNYFKILSWLLNDYFMPPPPSRSEAMREIKSVRGYKCSFLQPYLDLRNSAMKGKLLLIQKAYISISQRDVCRVFVLNLYSVNSSWNTTMQKTQDSVFLLPQIIILKLINVLISKQFIFSKH